MRFRYKAVQADGSVRRGELEAVTDAAAVSELRDAGYIPIRVNRAEGLGGLSLKRPRLSGVDVHLFTRELAVLLHAGVPLDRALALLNELADSKALQNLVADVLERVRSGAALSAAMEAQAGPFTALHIAMVRAGEAAGTLEKTLSEMADYQKRSRQLRDSVVSALIYPCILVSVAGISVVLLLAFVVPRFSRMFQDMGSTLPLATQIVMLAGEAVRSYGWTLPLLLLGVLLYFRHQLAEPRARLRWHRRQLQLPLVGALVTRVEVARFSRTLGVLVGNGVPLLKALTIVRGVLANLALADAVDAVSQGLHAGQGLSQPLERTGLFPKLAVQMLKVGEESGQLDDMLGKLAEVYDEEVRRTTTRLLAVLEPMLIVGLGVIIAGIIMSILVAMLGMNRLLA